MNRKEFMQSMALFPLLGMSQKLTELARLSSDFRNTSRMPMLFLGHGSPMNAIEENDFVRGFRKVSGEMDTPSAILCISAHWETRGTLVTAMPAPRTIHDFGGFPKELYDVQYPAPGSPELAQMTQRLVSKTQIELDHDWGLDHGAWSVIKHMYPDADIPVIQLSLDIRKSPAEHYELAKELEALRHKGVLIIGSGNMVHNLRRVDWQNLGKLDYAFDWAREASDNMKRYILNGNHNALINYNNQGNAFRLAVPTAEHYLPLLYVLALKKDREEIQLFNDIAVGGALTMTSVRVN